MPFPLLFPPRCLLCGAPAGSGEDILCKKCRNGWELEKRKRCPECGCGVEFCRCIPSALTDTGVSGIVSAVFYTKRESAARSLLLFAKRRASTRLAGFFARELAGCVSERNFSLADSVLTYVPRSPAKRREFGFDQAELIASSLSPLLGLPLVRPLTHRGDTEQKLLGGAERTANAAGSYFLKPEASLDGRNVLLIDDIITTGSSMAACVRRLKEADAGSIYCAAVGRTRES